MQGEVAQLGEGCDAVAFLGVDGGCAEVVGHTKGFESRAEGGQDLACAIVRVPFDDGERAVLGAEELDDLNHAAEEAG